MTKVCEAMYLKIVDWYGTGIKILSFGDRKLSFRAQQLTFRHYKVNFGDNKSAFRSPKSVKNQDWSNFGPWNGPKSVFAKECHLFFMILEIILGAQSGPKCGKIEL